MDKETFIQIHNLMSDLVGKEGHNHTADVITNLFNLHNKAYPFNREEGRSCAGCRARVYARLKTYWHENRAAYNL